MHESAQKFLESITYRTKRLYLTNYTSEEIKKAPILKGNNFYQPISYF